MNSIINIPTVLRRPNSGIFRKVVPPHPPPQLILVKLLLYNMHILGGEKEEVLHKTMMCISFHLSYSSNTVLLCFL